MNPVSTVRRRLAREQAYECSLCAARYDRERLNCPACGAATVERA